MSPNSVSAVLEKLIRRQDHAWSPQAASLRELAVHAPGRLHANVAYTYFTTLQIMGKDVSVIDEGLLRFSKLEELVLSANKITEVPAEHLPGTLKASLLEQENSSSAKPLPHLESLSLASNALGSCEDTSRLTGTHWPQLVCLDLGDCEFQDQRALLDALSTLPRLRTLVLEGNPFRLASCYPGFTVDRLPKLFYLDSTWISPQERDCFRGLAQMSGLTFDWTSAIVRVGKLKGIPDPLIGTENNTSSFPAASYQTESNSAAKHNLEDEDVTSSHSKPEWNHEHDTSTPDRNALMAGADSPVKPGSIKDRSKNKKKPAPQLLQDTPIRRVLGSVHVPLQSLLRRPQKVLKTQKDQDGGREKPSTPQGKSREERGAEPSAEASASVQTEPATVEFSVALEKRRSAADAHHLSACGHIRLI
ncbi:Leucine-rich repeat-containing protein 43 [Takifugu flavidus]|uniref:Leucine-rich repeat-containing protein 43 n=1 Tax=Takifugu flavidus TaxID=433684 RepID=A0A5C6MZL9_9TELE|nr:Leucine-rich repeat-containing protein 43 [Takifugu flavidus]